MEAITPYRKPFTSVSDQLTLLQERGLIIENPGEAGYYLTHVGYYRLAGFWQFYQSDRKAHTFRAGTGFSHIIDLYNFDRELRLLLLDAIERIEVSFRAVLINEMSANHGPNWLHDASFAYDYEVMNDLSAVIQIELERSNEDFIKHHEKVYGKIDPPPVWKTLQVVSFGTLSKIYGNIKKDVPAKKQIARLFGLPGDGWLHSWMQVISVLRNYCAHHSRICYRIFSFPPKEMRRPRLPYITTLPEAGGRFSQQLYYQICAVRYLLHTAHPNNQFNGQLKMLMAKFPTVHIHGFGFPQDWQLEPLWQ